MAHEPAGGEFYPDQAQHEEYPIDGQQEPVELDYAEDLGTEALDEAAVAVETVEVEEVHGPTTQRQRAAMRSGQHLRHYVRRTRGDDAGHGNGLKSDRMRRRRLRELQEEDNRRPRGGGLQWWLNQVKKAKATHGDACSCMYCLSPYN